MRTENIVLDSCVVIDVMEKPRASSMLRGRLRGKQVTIILCDIVLGEVARVRGYGPERIAARISDRLGKRVRRYNSSSGDVAGAQQITEQIRGCHDGDNRILRMCQARDYVLVTADRMLLRACEFVGVAAFHPTGAGGI